MASAKDFQDVSSVEKGTPDLTNSGQVSVSSTISYTAEEERRVLRKGERPGRSSLWRSL